MVISNELPQLGDASAAIAGRFVPLLLTTSGSARRTPPRARAPRRAARDPQLGARRARSGSQRAAAGSPGRLDRRGDHRAAGPRLARSPRSCATAASRDRSTRSPSTSCGTPGSRGPRTTAIQGDEADLRPRPPRRAPEDPVHRPRNDDARASTRDRAERARRSSRPKRADRGPRGPGGPPARTPSRTVTQLVHAVGPHGPRSTAYHAQLGRS